MWITDGALSANWIRAVLLLLEQADVGNNQWRTTRMILVMNARILFKPIKLDTTLELSHYIPAGSGMTYQQAIQQLRSNPEGK